MPLPIDRELLPQKPRGLMIFRKLAILCRRQKGSVLTECSYPIIAGEVSRNLALESEF
jgi:hypothetical protein